MGKYIIFGSKQGVCDAKNTVKRARAVREQFASLGVNTREFFWTMGHYDVVLTFDAPDETMMRATLAVAVAGNVRTTTMRGLREQEMDKVLARLPR